MQFILLLLLTALDCIMALRTYQMHLPILLIDTLFQASRCASNFWFSGGAARPHNILKVGDGGGHDKISIKERPQPLML